MTVRIIGAGLAGCEAAVYLADRGTDVELCDIKPEHFTPAHSDANFCELVCSNSLKSANVYSNACGLLKEEMRVMGSVTMDIARETAVPAGEALAVDRHLFAAAVTREIKKRKNIKIFCVEVTDIPRDTPCIVATGPLTQGPLADRISELCGGGLSFYDASAPVVTSESLDPGKMFAGDRYGRGNGDYINCPMTREEYNAFVGELLLAERAQLHEFEKGDIFEGCMPLEVMAARGHDTLRFGPLKPVGLTDAGGARPYAALQLRRENAEGTLYNLVGCQTNLKFGEQKRVFSLIPALADAEFVRYGVMHRNTFICSPKCLSADFSLRDRPDVFFAGQITGVEGYVESAASGIIAAVNMRRRLEGKTSLVPGDDTVTGALAKYISSPNRNFQPMNANFGIMRPPDTYIKDKRERYRALAERALASIKKYRECTEV